MRRAARNRGQYLHTVYRMLDEDEFLRSVPTARQGRHYDDPALAAIVDRLIAEGRGPCVIARMAYREYTGGYEPPRLTHMGTTR